MRIKRIRLSAFGRFGAPFEATFEEGVNIVLGPNESGKTTLMEGFLAILFGLKDKAAEDRLRPRDGQGTFGGELEFRAGDADYQVARDFDSHRVSVTRKRGAEATILYQGEANPRGRTDDLLAYLAVLGEMAGFTDREMALKTLFMRQGELETAVDEQVRHLLTGSQKGDYDTVIGRLEERLFGLTRENPWGRRKSRPREIEEIEDRIAALGARLERSRGALRQGGALLEEMEAGQATLAQTRGRREEKNTLFELYREFFELNRERGDLEKRLRVLREEKEKVRALTAECEKSLADLAGRYEHFRQAGPEFGELLRSLSTVERDMADMADELAKREAELAANPWPRQTRRGLIVGAIAAVVATAAMFGAGVGYPSIAIGLVVGVLSAVGLYFLGKGRERERIRLEELVLELEDRIEKQKAEMARLESDVRPVIGTRRLHEVVEDFRQYRELADLLSRHEQIRDSHRSLADVEADYEQVFQKLRIDDARARDLIARAPYLAGADQDLDEVAGKVEQLKRDLAALAAEEQGATERVEELKIRRARQEGSLVDDAESLEDELAELKERLAALVFRRDALRLAIEALRDCVQEFQEGHVERLAQRAGEHLARVTEGRWPRLVLDRSFAPSLVDAEGRSFTPEALSQGARDQLHLALRLAITEEIFGDRLQPLLLDDVLVNCDARRRETIRSLVDDQARAGRQVILFSHDPSFAAWGRLALNLDSAAAEAAPPVTATRGRRR